jgi:malate dehydrogenase (oxaloacetate-decarboxylating)
MIYPGLAAGVIVSKATRLSDELIVAGVEALANLSPALENPDDALLPDLHDVRNISMKVAAAVARAAQKEGLAQRKDLPEDADELEELIRHDAWEPRYRTIMPI